MRSGAKAPEHFAALNVKEAGTALRYLPAWADPVWGRAQIGDYGLIGQPSSPSSQQKHFAPPLSWHSPYS